MLSIDRILVATDFSPSADRALEEAKWLATRLGSDLYVTHVLRPLGEDPLGSAFDAAQDLPEPGAAAIEQAEARLGELAAGVGGGVHVVEVLLTGHDVAAEIRALAHKRSLDFVVMGTHGKRGFKRFVLGSVAEAVVSGADCPVLTVRAAGDGDGDDHDDADALLLPVDLSTVSIEAVHMAMDVARAYEAPIHLLHVIEPYAVPVSLTNVETFEEHVPEQVAQAEARLKQLVAGTDTSDVEMHVHVRYGRPGPTIVEACEEFDCSLIVLVRRRKSVLDRLLEYSVVKQVLRRGPDRVLTLTVPVDDVRNLEQIEQTDKTHADANYR